eukprot:1161278-Pelagomonas_calceolata.AAC.4
MVGFIAAGLGMGMAPSFQGRQKMVSVNAITVNSCRARGQCGSFPTQADNRGRCSNCNDASCFILKAPSAVFTTVFKNWHWQRSTVGSNIRLKRLKLLLS